jgi:hypothetical protein
MSIFRRINHYAAWHRPNGAKQQRGEEVRGRVGYQHALLLNYFIELKGLGGEERAALCQALLGCAYSARCVETHEGLVRLPAARQATRGRGGRGRGRGRGRGAASSSSSSSRERSCGIVADANASSNGEPFGRALAFGATVVKGTLSIYCMHVQLRAPGEAYAAATAASARPLRGYHKVILDSFEMTMSAEHYYAAIAAVRNVRKLARDFRVAAISAANARVANMLSPLPAYTSSQRLYVPQPNPNHDPNPLRRRALC